MTSYKRLADIEAAGRRAAVATVIRAQGSVPRHEGSKMVIFPDGRTEGTIGGGELEHRVIEAAQRVIERGRLERLNYAFRDPQEGDVGVCGGEMEVLVEPIQSPPTVMVIGAGHVGQAVCHLASWLGFRIVVADDRPEFATPEASPGADSYVTAPLDTLAEQLEVHEHTFILLTTRSVEVDLALLPALLKANPAYLGVIGSRRRWETAVEQLLASGVDPEALGRVVSPMGLELSAETPEEIALSMMAQIVMLYRGGTAERMAHQPKSLGAEHGAA
ncbi:MAG TPA: XdhC family protein [Anaerolineales bacterium]